MTENPNRPSKAGERKTLFERMSEIARGQAGPTTDEAEAARRSFDEDHSVKSRRTGRDGRSISHSYGGEGRNYVD